MLLHHFCHINVIYLICCLSLLKFLRWNRFDHIFDCWLWLKKLGRQIVMVTKIEDLFTFDIKSDRS
jgi:hypothetical protein